VISRRTSFVPPAVARAVQRGDPAGDISHEQVWQ
jgi:hypothetical protein